MKSLVFPAILVAAYLSACSGGSTPSRTESVASEAAAAADAAEAAATPQSTALAIRSGWSSSEACSFLGAILVTRGYKHDFDDEYHCSSPYKDIGSSAAGLPNNLAYYATGSSNVVDTVKLVLNFNQPANATVAAQQLVTASKMLSLEATGKEIPQGILSAISSGRAATETLGDFNHEVRRDDWPTGRGYEIHYIVTKSAGR